MDEGLAFSTNDELSRLAELTGDVVYRTDVGGRITFVTDSVEGLLGYPPESLAGSHHLLLSDPSNRSEVHTSLSEQSLQGFPMMEREMPALSRSGERIWVGQRVFLQRGEGTERGFVIVLRNLEDRNRLAKESTLRDRRLAFLGSLSPDDLLRAESLQRVLGEASELVDADLAVVGRVENDVLRVLRYWPAESSLLEGQTCRLRGTLCERVQMTGDPLSRHDMNGMARTEVQASDDGSGLEAWAADPGTQAKRPKRVDGPCYADVLDTDVVTYMGAPIAVEGDPGLISFVRVGRTRSTKGAAPETAEVEFVRALASTIARSWERAELRARAAFAEDNLRTLLAQSSDGILACTPRGRILTANPKAGSLIGTTDLSVGEDVRLYLPDFLRAAERVPEDGSSEPIAMDVLRRDGKRVGLEVTIVRRTLQEGSLITAFIRDRSGSRRHAARLVSRDATLRAFYDGTPFLMGVVSLVDGRLEHLSANSAAIDFFGLVGSGNPKDARVRLPRTTTWEAACGRCLAERKPIRFEVSSKDRWLAVTLNQIEDPSGETPRFSYVVEDATVGRAQAMELVQSRAEFEAIYRSIPHAAVFVGPDRGIVAVNPAFTKIFGYVLDEVQGSDAAMLFAEGEDIQFGGGVTVETPDAGSPPSFGVTYRRKDGSTFESETIGVHVRDGRGGTLGFLSLIQDVTRRNATRRRIRMQAEILAQVQDAVVVLDHEMRVTYWNAGAEALSGFSPEESEGRSMMRLTPFRWTAQDQEVSAVQTLMDQKSWKGRLELRVRDGRRVFVDVVVSVMRDGEGEASGMLVLARDATATVSLENKLRRQARADALTDLPNRAVLDERVGEAIRQRNVHGKSFAVVFIDLDRFKLINDSLGHGVGDGLLVQVAARIRSVLHPNDLVARIGGDEFAVLLSEVDHESAVRTHVKRMAEALNQPFRIAGKDLPGSASLGVVMGESRYSNPSEILRDADTAMYAAKRRAPGTYLFFSEAMHEEVAHKFRLESDLAFAAENDQLELYYQPIVSLRDGSLEGFEALVRWNHPELGMLMPDVFLPLAMDRGCLAEIDHWVLREATAQLSYWRGAYSRHKNLVMHVNASSDTILTKAYLACVQEVSHSERLPAGALEIEITEQVLVRDPNAAVAILNSIRETGANLSVDDFGTGYSSLNMLHRLPIQTIKTDRSLLSSERGSHILETVAKLSGALDTRLIGEGVETEADLALLRKLGFEFGQGYLFSRPRSASQAERLFGTPGWLAYWQSAGRASDRDPGRMTGSERGTPSRADGLADQTSDA